MAVPALKPEPAKTASRADPALRRAAPARRPASYGGVWENRPRYDRAASSGSVVDGDPLNESDPEGMWPLGAPKGGFKFGNIQVPSEQSVINQLQAALLKAGTCKNSGQAHQIAVDIANKIGWGDLNLAQSLYKSIQNNKPLTKPQQNAAQNFVNGLPAPDQGPLQQLLSKQ